MRGGENASARKITSGCSSRTSRINHSQNANGLVCGLSTRKAFTPCSTQNSTTSSHSCQRFSQSSVSQSTFTMSWYFLGGFSAYFMLPSGRNLNHSGCSFMYGWSGEHWIAKSSATSILCSSARLHEVPEVLQRPQFRVDGFVPALLAPDGVGAAGVAGGGGEGVVLTLAVGRADGVDGEQVDHIEAHPRYLRQPHLRLPESRAPARLRALRAVEHLVPGPVASRDPVHEDFQRLVEGRGGTVRITVHQLLHFLRAQERQPLLVGSLVELLQQTVELLFGGAFGGFLDQLAAFEKLQLHALAGLDLLADLPAPGLEVVRPGFDLVYS